MSFHVDVEESIRFFITKPYNSSGGGRFRLKAPKRTEAANRGADCRFRSCSKQRIMLPLPKVHGMETVSEGALEKQYTGSLPIQPGADQAVQSLPQDQYGYWYKQEYTGCCGIYATEHPQPPMPT